MEHIAAYIQSNLGVDAACIKISCLAREFGLCETKLKKGFKEAYGIPVHQYVIDQRIQMACGLLSNSTFTIKEIAAELRYSTLHNFSRDFKAHTGLAPRVYRAKAVVGNQMKKQQDLLYI